MKYNIKYDRLYSIIAVRPFTNLQKSFGGFSSEKWGEVVAA